MRAGHRAVERLVDRTRIAGERARALFARSRGASLGTKARLGKGCRLDRPWCITAGPRLTVEELVYFKCVDDEAQLHFGTHVFVGRGTQFDVLKRIYVGDHTLIAPGCFITDHEHGTSSEARLDEQQGEVADVHIGKDVWLGAQVMIRRGVTIGDGAIVGAGAVVTRNVESGSIVAGVPASSIGRRGETKWNG